MLPQKSFLNALRVNLVHFGTKTKADNSSSKLVHIASVRDVGHERGHVCMQFRDTLTKLIMFIRGTCLNCLNVATTPLISFTIKNLLHVLSTMHTYSISVDVVNASFLLP